MDQTERQAALDALARIPGFANRLSRARLTRLKGLTNLVYDVDLDGERFALRIPGAGTERIDRAAEAQNARAAAKAGVAPEMLHFGEDGLMLTRFVDDAIPLSAAGFRDDSAAIERAASAMQRLHNHADAFAGEFNAFDYISRYEAILTGRAVKLPGIYASIQQSMRRVRDALMLRPAQPKPCHCDPTGANLLDNGERVLFIDWEFSAMNDPAWDLAYLSVEANFDAAADRRLLQAYFNRPAAAAEFARIVLYKAVTEAVSGLWALIQDNHHNRRADFQAYAESTLARCGVRLHAPDFPQHVDAVRRG